jgi:hypothetical protein
MRRSQYRSAVITIPTDVRVLSVLVGGARCAEARLELRDGSSTVATFTGAGSERVRRSIDIPPSWRGRAAPG